jgi:hypothetical protein
MQQWFNQHLPEQGMNFARDLTITMIVWALVTCGAMVWINYDIPGIWPEWLGPSLAD